MAFNSSSSSIRADRFLSDEQPGEDFLAAVDLRVRNNTLTRDSEIHKGTLK